MAERLVVPLIDSSEGYEEDLDPNADGIGAHGFYPQKSTGFDRVVGIERDELGNLVVKDGVTGSFTLAQLIGGPSPLAGYNAVDDSETSTTASTWQQKLSLSLPQGFSGNVWALWYAEIRTSAANKEFSAQAALDDTDQLGYARSSLGLVNGVYVFSGFAVRTLVAGDHHLDIDYQRFAGSPAYTVFIKRARLAVWRIG